jgi:glycosyltransferase involved in cell wall biosynthesis
VAKLWNLAESVGVPDQLVVLGWVTDEVMAALYQQCEVMVFPSTSEGLGLPVMEALACGAAVLVADRLPMSDLVVADAARFDPTSPRQLSERLGWLFTDTTGLTDLRASAHEAARRHSWKASIGNVLAAYERAARL